MKLVWVNRFNADGSAKPMNEWVQREIKSKYTTHFATYPDGRIQEHDANFADNKQENLIVEICGKFDVCLEYIGNQRGDGWFYVADGDLPLLNELVYTYDGSRLKVDCMARIGLSSEPWFADDPDEIVKCWQPIQPPKYLD